MREAKHTTRSIFILLITLLIAVGISDTQAQTNTPWRDAEIVRQTLFDAQKSLLLRKPDEAGSQVTEAIDLYNDSLASELETQLPDIHALVTQQLDAAEQAIEQNDQVALGLARGQLWTGLLQAGYQGALQAVQQNQSEAAHRWLLLREFRPSTRFSRPDADATLAVEALGQGDIEPDVAEARLKADLLDTYQALLTQELDAIQAAADQNFTIRQAESVGLAIGYWRILQPAYADQLGVEAEQQAITQFERLLADGPTSQANDVTALIEAAREPLRSFRAAPLAEEELSRRAGQLLRFISLVGVEYNRGVKDGQIFLAFEIQEATTFVGGAKAAFEDLRLPLEQRNSNQTAAVEALINKLQDTVQAANRKEAIAHEDIVTEDVAATLDILADIMPAEWQELDPNADFDVIGSVLDLVEEAVASGEYTMAESARLEAYAVFDFGPEPRLLAFAPEMVARIDGIFWHGHEGQAGLAQALAADASPEEIAAIRQNLDEALSEAQRILGDGPTAPGAIIINAAVIVFREGLEAVVILAALLASLVGGYQAYRRPMIAGAILAFIASAITWVIAQQILLLFSQYGERLEAVVSLIAIVVLLIITNWFFHKVYWTEWIGRFHKQKSRLVGGAAGQFLGLMMLGFSSIYREGFETVLFLQALVLDAGTWIVLQGVALGLVGVAIVGFFTFRLQKRLPYKKMLVLTGILIGGVLLIIVGNTIHIMQAVRWMTFTPIQGLDIPYWMGLWLGLFPTWEGIIAQVAAATFVIGSYYLAEYQHKSSRASRRKKGKDSIEGKPSTLNS
ncbi:MAG: FTR1 family protein [Chloroflexota bacterium]